MITPSDGFRKLKSSIKPQWILAFCSTAAIGILIHMPAMLMDVPNHDGLASMHYNQNMITSGRWFLTVACGISSYYTIPWLIGLLGFVYLGLASAALTELLEVKKSWAIVMNGGLLAAFPALASTYAYVFTLDGYMLAVFLAVLAVLLTKKYRKGFLPGAVCLAFSMGIYQAYLSVAMTLSLFAVCMLFAGEGKPTEKGKGLLRYLGMGIFGAALYYGILQVLLRIQGKQLASYQGINGMAAGGRSLGLLETVQEIYRDFMAFTLKGNVLFQNAVSCLALCLLLAAAAVAGAGMVRHRKWWKKPLFFVIMAVVVVLLPLSANIILLVSPEVTYHLLMRYQWVLYLMGLTAFVSRRAEELKRGAVLEWAAFAAAFLLIVCYGVADNVGYANLQRRYEKTYAYCVRLLDRIEQTDGYYPGIPIAMVGVIGDEQFPVTDITLPVTSGMIGLSGDWLLYTGENYRAFMEHYLGATLNILPPEAMGEMYYEKEYVEMESFPGEDSIRIIDGIMYIKTENAGRE